MLGQHPGLYAVPYESNIFAIPRTRRTQVVSLRAWQAQATAAGKPRFCEKTPQHVSHLGRLFRGYPSARVVVITRDGRDVAASLGRRWDGDVERAIRRWVTAVESGRAWLGDERVLEVRYEDLVRSPEATLRTVCSHIIEPYYEAMIEGDQPFLFGGAETMERPETLVGADINSLRSWQVNQPVFDGSGGWKRSLTPEQQDLCWRLAGPWLVELGYAEDIA
jgi:hypothetical protein